jgi:hypothetical protein
VVRRLFVGPDGVVDLDGGVEAGRAEEGVAPDLPQWLAEHPSSEVQILLSGRLVYPLVVTEPALARAQRADQLAWVRQQFLHFHGAPSAGWPLVLAADPPTLAAAALHGVDLAVWQAGAANHGSRLSRLQPWWTTAPSSVAHALPSWPGEGPVALMLVEGAHASWLSFNAGRLIAIEQRRAASPGGDALATLLVEWQQEHGLDAAATTVAGFGVAGGVDTLRACARVVGELSSPQLQPARAGP